MSQDLKFAPVLQVRARCSLFVELGEKRVERQVATKLLPVADAGPATFAQPIMVKQKTRAFVQGSFEAALRRKGWVWRLLSVTHLHTRGYVGQIQAEAKIFLSRKSSFLDLSCCLANCF